jgi:3-phosphoshikimate 1-carboxyvinyltransferase
VRGTLRVPGDKSISHRAAMLGALAGGESVIEGFLTSADCLNTLAAVAALGAAVRREGTRVRLGGTGGRFRAPAHELDFGNSGTGLRLLAGLLAGHEFTAQLTGDASLRARPMRRIREPLERMGARVELLGAGGCAPLRIAGGRLRGIEYALPVASAQVKSCVLLAGLFAEGVTTVIEPEATRDHTERLLARLGIPLRREGLRVSVTGTGGAPLRLPAGRLQVPGDFSSAAFWLAAAAAREGSEVCIRGVGLNPRRTAFLDVLRRMGAEVEVAGAGCGEEGGGGGAEAGEPAGTVVVRGRRLRGTEIGGGEIPNLVDELPAAAAAGALAEGRTLIRDAAELRVKESDRIAAMCACLRAFGVAVEERPDGLLVRGGTPLRGGGAVDSRGDHRIAMAAAVLALCADSPARINGVACIATSYPAFWDDGEALTGGAWKPL